MMAHDDAHLQQAIDEVRAVLEGARAAPIVKGFFHEPTFTASYVVHDPQTKQAAIVDSVLDFDQPSGRTSTEYADEMIAYVRDAGLTVTYLLETHAHADHLSAAPYLQEQLGGVIAAIEAGFFRREIGEAAFAYQQTVDELCSGESTAAYLGPLTYVRAHAKCGAEPILLVVEPGLIVSTCRVPRTSSDEETPFFRDFSRR